MKVAEIIAALPDWKNEKPPMWSFDRRLLILSSRAADGRPLIVEVLSKVNGLEREDLEATAAIEQGGATYRVLDPIAMLKAKAANVRDLDQDGPPPRQDRAHLQIIAQCVAPFLRDAHQQALADPTLHGEFAKTISRTFHTLSQRHTLRTLLTEGIRPTDLLPLELRDCPIEKVRSAFEHQVPRLQGLVTAGGKQSDSRPREGLQHRRSRSTKPPRVSWPGFPHFPLCSAFMLFASAAETRLRGASKIKSGRSSRRTPGNNPLTRDSSH
jgi:hypothetical protein